MTEEVDKPRPEPWKDGRLPEVLCTAKRSNGEPCKKPPIKGSTVCRVHGGAAGQVKRKAQIRLLMAADVLMASLLKIAKDESVPVAVRLAAIRDGLDRAGLTAKAEVDVDVKVSLWEQNMAGIITVVSEVVREEPGQIVDAEVVDPFERQAEVDAAMDRDNADRARAKKGLPPAPQKEAPVSMTPPKVRSSVPDYDGPTATDLPKPPKRTAKQRAADETANAANKAVEAREARQARTMRRPKRQGR